MKHKSKNIKIIFSLAVILIKVIGVFLLDNEYYVLHQFFVIISNSCQVLKDEFQVQFNPPLARNLRDVEKNIHDTDLPVIC